MIKLIKQFVVIGIFALLIGGGAMFTGLYNPVHKKLVGTWHVSFEVTSADLQQLGVTANPLIVATADTLMKTTRTEMRVQFLGDKTIQLDMSTFGFLVAETGTWKVVGNDGDQVVLATQFTDAEPKEWKLVFLDDDTFQMKPPPNSPFPVSQLVVFKRVKAPEA